MIIIAAMGNDRVIGSGDGMPWDVPDEYRRFLSFVDGQAVIMGRRSWEIFGGDLASSHNVVVSRTASEIAGAAAVARSLDDAVEIAAGFGRRVFCAGGARIYAQAVPFATTMYLSFIRGDFTGDAHFPAFDESAWRISRREDHPAFEFRVYERLRSG